MTISGSSIVDRTMPRGPQIAIAAAPNAPQAPSTDAASKNHAFCWRKRSPGSARPVPARDTCRANKKIATARFADVRVKRPRPGRRNIVQMARRYDLLIRDAVIVDGTGAPSFRGDVGIEADRIASVGDLSASSADEEVLANGMMLAPGFIDAHTHDDRAILGAPAGMLCKLSQGVTTVVVGNCGISLAPHRMQRQPPAPLDLLGGPELWEFDSFGAYAERLARQPPVVNAVALIGNMSLRAAAMAFDFERAATDEECARMRDRLAAALNEGASGFSTGLWYPPSRHAPTQEILAVAEALREAQGLYVTHLR